KLRVPDDVSVVGFDDIQSAAYQNPALTTVRQPLREMGRIAAETLLRRIRRPQRPPPQIAPRPKPFEPRHSPKRPQHNVLNYEPPSLASKSACHPNKIVKAIELKKSFALSGISASYSRKQCT